MPMRATFAHEHPVRRPAVGRHDHLLAETIGCRVPTWGIEGRVDAVFERACNVMLETGGLVAVLSNSAGNVAHGIRLTREHRFDLTFERGATARIVGDRMVLGDGAIAIHLSGARVWHPRFPRSAGGCNERARDAALRIKDILGRVTLPLRSEFLATVLGMAHQPTPLTTRVAQILPKLAHATRGYDLDDAVRLLAQLIGLGPGLTPAGDDFIIGWLAGLALSAATSPQLEFLQAVRRGIDALRHATTTVSCQHLGDACALMFSERLSDLCCAIAVATPGSTLAALVRAQASVGASSGADAAAGLLFALLACAPDPN
jgi:hypothetical protein